MPAALPTATQAAAQASAGARPRRRAKRLLRGCPAPLRRRRRSAHPETTEDEPMPPSTQHMTIFQPNLAQFCPLARVVAGFLGFVTFHNVAMHVKFYFLP
jgi:hypothetical protein